MRIAITGATGLVGTALVSFLEAEGHEAIPLSRGTGRGRPEHSWIPETGLVDAAALGPLDALVHLAGESVAASRWSAEVKARIRNSRVGPTEALARTIAAAPTRPAAFISASAIGYYGDRGDETLTERSRRGQGFLADVCEAWEGAADPARQAGIRVVHPRFGIILDATGGALGTMRLPFSLGLGGRLGSGEQWYSWVGIQDVVRALLFAITQPQLHGPMNVTAPNPVTNADFTATLGQVLRRPAVLPVPGFVLRALVGEMADAELLASKKVLPAALQEHGFSFVHPQLEDALRFTLDGAESQRAV